MWGLGQTVGLEFPALWGGLVDLPAELDDYAFWFFMSDDVVNVFPKHRLEIQFVRDVEVS